MKINKILWEFKSFFTDTFLIRLMGMFMFIVVMVELVIPKVEIIWVRYFLGGLTIAIAIAICLESLFEVELLKKPEEIQEK